MTRAHGRSRGGALALPARTLALAMALLSARAHAVPQGEPAGAAAPSPAADPPAVDAEAERRDAARMHFERGLAHFDRGAWDASIVEFRRSRELFPTRVATRNAAVALQKLGRFDEALEMFEQLLTFPALPADDKDLAERELRALRGLVGTLEIRGAPDGATVTIDGRDRGVAPLPAARVSAGTRLVRIFREGFAPFEVTADVVGNQPTVVEARLRALTRAGRLKVVEAGGAVVDIVVDGVVVGQTPWEGSLAPGEHAVQLRGEGPLGTQPATVPVTVDQVTSLTLAVEELTATIRVEPAPAGAVVAIDGVSVGRGLWEGRVRAGLHRIEVLADGFSPFSRELAIAAGGREVLRPRLERVVERRVAESPSGLVLGVDAAFALAPSLGGDVLASCDEGCSSGLGLGLLARGHGGYQFGNGFVLGIEGGYLLLTQRAEGRSTAITPFNRPANVGTAEDTLRLGGVMIGGTAGYHFGKAAPLMLRLGVGALLGSVRDRRAGTFTTSAGVDYEVDMTQVQPGASLYVAPELRLAIPLGEHLELGVGLSALVLIGLSTPRWDPGATFIDVPGEGRAMFDDDALSGRLVVVLAPGLGARYRF